MNNTIYYDTQMTDDERRAALFDGQLCVYSPTKCSLALIEFARNLIKEAFEPHDPEKAQFDMPVEEYAGLLTKLKPNFIHHPESSLIECFSASSSFSYNSSRSRDRYRRVFPCACAANRSEKVASLELRSSKIKRSVSIPFLAGWNFPLSS